jgi:hypothetical protein
VAEEVTRQVLPTAMGFAAKEAIAALRDRRIEIAPLLRRAGLSEHEQSAGKLCGVNPVRTRAMATAFSVAESGRPGAAYVNLPIDVMAAPNPYSPLPEPAFAGLGPADGTAIAEAARLINVAKNPVVLVGMLASRPANAEALQTFLTNGRLPVVGTFQAAAAVGAPQFDNFGGRVGQIANQPGDRLLDSSDLVITIGYDPVEYWPPEWNAGKTRKIIHIDVLPADFDNQASARSDARPQAFPPSRNDDRRHRTHASDSEGSV